MATAPASTDHLQEQGKSLQEAIATVNSNFAQLKRCLDQGKLMDGLKHCSTLLAELRTSALGPKQYYELYMAVFDALRHLSTYLHEAHVAGKHHLADLYELVQYAGNVVPRLYLMITVGSVYMSLEDAPVREIMKDMMEMSRAVQHPIRGLFLRHYLSGQTRNTLPTSLEESPRGSLKDSISFVLTNFVEMNKLWVRLQHQGHSRERPRREQERLEIKTLVGTNLVRLSQLEGLDLELYSTQVLPAILEQIVQCKDVLAQEYLMEVVVQAFTDELNLRTLDQYLSATAKLNPSVNIRQVISCVMDRLSAYALRESENESSEERRRKETKAAGTLHEKLSKLSTDNEVRAAGQTQDMEVAPASNTAIPDDIKLVEIFWRQILGIVEARPEISLEDTTAMLLSLASLALNCYPDQLEYVDRILAYAKTRISETKDSPEVRSQSVQSNILSLLLAPISAYKSIFTVLVLPSYNPLLQEQPTQTQVSVAVAIVHAILTSNIKISSSDHAEGILQLLKVVIKDNPSTAAQNGKSQINQGFLEVSDEQVWLAKLVHSLHSDDLEDQQKLLQVARKAFAEGSGCMRLTTPSLVFKSLALIRAHFNQREQSKEWHVKVASIFKQTHQLISSLYDRSGVPELSLRLFVSSGQVAEQCGFEDVAYEFIAQAFVVYEESISDSKAQFQAITNIANALYTTRNFSRDNYETLVTKVAAYGSRLLKKPDQARVIYSVSHLSWQPDDPDSEEKPFCDGKRVLESMQRSLKIADACMDSNASIELFVEVLNRYIYFYDRQVDTVIPRFLNNLIDLTRQNIDNLEPQAESTGKSATSSSAVYEPSDGKYQTFIKGHFERTLSCIRSKASVDERWQEIKVD